MNICAIVLNKFGNTPLLSWKQISDSLWFINWFVLEFVLVWNSFQQMNEEEKQELIQKTQKWYDDPIFFLFKDPVPDTIPNYYEIIKHPMDLFTVIENLRNNKYITFVEWYNDVKQIFDNSLEFNMNDPLIVALTTYLKDKFEEEFSVRAITDLNEWKNKVAEQMNKIKTLLAQSPVIQGIDPMLISIIKTSENKPPPNQHDIALLASKLNPKMQENEDIRRDVYMILKATEPNKIHDSIDISTLSASSQYALFSYLEAKM